METDSWHWAEYARLCGATGIKAVRREELDAAMLHVEQDPELL